MNLKKNVDLLVYFICHISDRINLIDVFKVHEVSKLDILLNSKCMSSKS